MINNDILRSIRYALDLHDSSIVTICELGGQTLEPASVTALLKKEEEESFLTCTDLVMGAFLDGLILQKRGKKEGDNSEQVAATSPLTNNVILKKLRIALELQEDTILAILEKTDTGITRARLSALFRKEGHKNYKECGDQFLRNFLKGLALHVRAQRGKSRPAGPQSP
jgi:uncharacterized protein YehS (DUF1456 family)